MEEFIHEIETYASALGLHPSTIVQRSGAGGGAAWGRWTAVGGSCSMRTADRIRAYMRANPPREDAQSGEAA